MIRRPPRSTRVRSSAASDVYKRQGSVGLSNQVWRVVTDEALRVSTSLTRLSISCDLARAASAGLPGHQDKSGRARAPLPNGRGEAELALADPECHAKGRLARVASYSRWRRVGTVSYTH